MLGYITIGAKYVIFLGLMHLSTHKIISSISWYISMFPNPGEYLANNTNSERILTYYGHVDELYSEILAEIVG